MSVDTPPAVAALADADPSLGVDAASVDRPQTVGQWAAAHGLIPALLPFNYRDGDSFSQFETLSQELAALPTTAATFTLGDLLGRGQAARAFGSSIVVQHQLRLLGAWPYRETSAGIRWINPGYIHAHPFESGQCSAAERRGILRWAARQGALTVGDVAPRFGVTEGSLRRYLTRHEIPWSEWRRDGIRRLARTLKTVADWTGRTQRAVAAPVERPTGTVRAWLSKFAGEWSPPADPSNHRGFQKGGEGR